MWRAWFDRVVFLNHCNFVFVTHGIWIKFMCWLAGGSRKPVPTPLAVHHVRRCRRQLTLEKKQKCIPLGCVPTTAVAMLGAGFCLLLLPLTRHPTPLTRHPKQPDQTPLWPRHPPPPWPCDQWCIPGRGMPLPGHVTSDALWEEAYPLPLWTECRHM